MEQNGTNSKGGEKWYNIYRRLAEALSDFKKKCDQDGQNTGQELYKKLIKSRSFLRENPWVNKFSQRFAIKSIDPVHLFASISGNKSNEVKRTEKIKILLNIFSINQGFDKINFLGCPAPNTVRILSVRQQRNQDEIWDLFGRIIEQRGKGLRAGDFLKLRNWFGLDIASITVFLFWIDTESFLPLERNVRTYIEVTGILPEALNDFKSYRNCLEILNKLNYQQNTLYGNNGIFREITLISYNTITKGIEQSNYSKELWSLIEKSSKGIGTVSLPEIWPFKIIVKTLILNDKTDEKIKIYRIADSCDIEEAGIRSGC